MGDDLLQKALDAVAALPPEQQREMWEAQRQSWARGEADLVEQVEALIRQNTRLHHGKPTDQVAAEIIELVCASSCNTNTVVSHETPSVRDKAAAHARIKVLEEERYKLAYAITGGEDAPGYLDSLSVETLVEVARDNARRWFAETDRAEALETKLAAAEKALEFYADASKWDDGYFKPEDDGTVLRAYPSSIEKDQGDKARAALGGKPS